MKQRSLSRTCVPGEGFQACIRAKYIKSSYPTKPCTMGSKKFLRQKMKEFYKKQKNKDREVGLQVSKLFQEFFSERIHIQKSGKSPDKETIKYLGNLAANIKELKELQRFRDDFPSFATFKRYFLKEKLTIKDLEEIG